MTEVLGIKYEEGNTTFVLPNKKYKKDDFVIVDDKVGSRLAQVVF